MPSSSFSFLIIIFGITVIFVINLVVTSALDDVLDAKRNGITECFHSTGGQQTGKEETGIEKTGKRRRIRRRRRREFVVQFNVDAMITAFCHYTNYLFIFILATFYRLFFF